MFTDPTYASSRPTPPPSKDKFTHIPALFHRVKPFPDSPSFGHYFGKYLVNNGYSVSEVPENALLILDHSPVLEERRKSLELVSNDQVAICLMPTSESARADRVIRENNIIYVKGPLLPCFLEEALEEANAVLAEFASSRAEPPGRVDASVLEGTTACSLSNPERPALERADSLLIPMQDLHIGIDATSKLNTITPLPSPPLGLLKPLKASRPSALVVDDNAINLRIMQMYCNRRKLSYCCAVDGSQAISIFKHHRSCSKPINLVLMDLQMPVCDGIEACRQIRDLEKKNRWERSVIFIVTGQDSPSDRANADKAGADGFFVKPVGPKAMDRGLGLYFPSFDVS